MSDAAVSPDRYALLRRALIVLLGLWLAWQIISLHMANHFTRAAQLGDAAAIDSALWWDAGHPLALELKARGLLRDLDALAAAEAGVLDENGAALQAPAPFNRPVALAELDALLRAALAADPARGNLLALLALSAQHRGTADAAAASLADRLAPVHPRVQRNLARYYLLQEDLAPAVIHLARAMVGDPADARDYYPLLMQVAADPAAREVLSAIASDPRPFPWWNGFFAHVAANAGDLDALRALVQLREASTALPLQEYERNLYINRLRREGRVAEAYLHWVNGLGKAQLGRLGYLYDGSFEEPFANDSGFGWVAQPPRNSGVRITRGDTYGATGDLALRVAFGGKRVRFSHLYQQVFLGAGRYEVSGRVRPDQLRARRGLQWRVYCSAGASGLLGESDLIAGTGDWREFRFPVTVPPDCSGQILRLYSAGNRDVDHELEGTVWFDDLQITLTR